MPAYYINCRNPVNLFAPPFARALLSGGEGFPGLWGKVDFCLCPPGLLILCEFRGLPYDADPCAPNLFALHLHRKAAVLRRRAMPLVQPAGTTTLKTARTPLTPATFRLFFPTMATLSALFTASGCARKCCPAGV